MAMADRLMRYRSQPPSFAMEAIDGFKVSKCIT